MHSTGEPYVARVAPEQVDQLIGDVIDVAQETARLEKEIGKLGGEIIKVEKKLGNQKFISRAPVEVVEENRERLADFKQARDKLKEALERLAAL